jgi:glutamate-ammonia-ligase adenylyltransferase
MTKASGVMLYNVPNRGNIKLLKIAEDEGLLPQGMGLAAARAYRELRRVQHKARLNEAPTQLVLSAMAAERDAILTLWRHVFPAGSGRISP